MCQSSKNKSQINLKLEERGSIVVTLPHSLLSCGGQEIILMAHTSTRLTLRV